MWPAKVGMKMDLQIPEHGTRVEKDRYRSIFGYISNLIPGTMRLDLGSGKVEYEPDPYPAYFHSRDACATMQLFPCSLEGEK